MPPGTFSQFQAFKQGRKTLSILELVIPSCHCSSMFNISKWQLRKVPTFHSTLSSSILADQGFKSYKAEGIESQGCWLLSIPSDPTWFAGWMGKEEAKFRWLYSRENRGCRRNWWFFLILTGEYCLTVVRDGQKYWFPIAAGFSILISTFFPLDLECLACCSHDLLFHIFTTLPATYPNSSLLNY